MSGHQAIETPDSSDGGSAEHFNSVADRQSIMSSWQRQVPLWLGFIGAFFISWLAVLALSFAFRSSPSQTVDAPKAEDVFSKAVSLSGQGTVVTVPHNQSLNPGEKDFLLYAWFKLKNELQDGERAPFLGKFSESSKTRAGYALALVGGADGIRPHVYWQNEAGKGRWYAFASKDIRPQQWYLFAVTFRAKRYLGVHMAPYGPESSPEVLGGYDLEGEIVPDSSAPLEIGAGGSSKFRGRVGPFAIFHDIDIARDGGKIVKQIAREPLSLPEEVEESNLAIWADPRNDLGPQHLEIQVGRRSGRE